MNRAFFNAQFVQESLEYVSSSPIERVLQMKEHFESHQKKHEDISP